MQKLLSLSPNLVQSFHELEQVNRIDRFCIPDPVGKKFGLGGGTAWLLKECYNEFADGTSFSGWLGKEKRILLHADGQNRRPPGYAPSGKILTSVPMFRWERGQHLGQNLLSLQLPSYEKIMSLAPENLHTLIASGDVYIRSEKPLQAIPDADVVHYGLWVDPLLITHHGVLASGRKHPEKLDFMLQEPSLDELEPLPKTHLFLMDIGIWLLSDRVMKVLMERSYKENSEELRYYDLYSDFGLALGTHPCIEDEEADTLSIAILPLPGGEFYHYGTSRELISSTPSVQNKVHDQRRIMHRKVKPNPATFVQNVVVQIPLCAENADLWTESSHIGAQWKIASRHIITGVPENDWALTVPAGVCVDVVPMGDEGFAARSYGLDDVFKEDLRDPRTILTGIPFGEWMAKRGLSYTDSKGCTDDLQATSVFPLTNFAEGLGLMLRRTLAEPELEEGKSIRLRFERFSADEALAGANLERLYAQREEFRKGNWKTLAVNHEKSVFYQLDLADAAEDFIRLGLNTPELLPEDALQMSRIHNRMLRARILKLDGKDYRPEEQAAFDLLRDELLGEINNRKSESKLDVYSDQAVWGRSSVRIDMAGRWTDTPPYSFYSGGNVVNLAIELSGQPPLQVYVEPCKDSHIVLCFIDMGAMEIVSTFDELQDYKKIGSLFSILKAILPLVGLAPAFFVVSYALLEKQLKDFGAGTEATLLAAILAGPGSGTSPILAFTALGATNDLRGLAWDKNEICQRTLAPEQLLTTGGGRQDQYGGVLQGMKLLQTGASFAQSPSVCWLPDHLFTHPEYKDCHLLYYTDITRTAKGILAEIASSMFLNSSLHLNLPSGMKAHTLDMNEVIQRGSSVEFGRLVGKTWEQNRALDSGTNPPAVEAIIDLIKDYTLGYKLSGVGGGGYLYMVARDPQAAARIHKTLIGNAPNPRACFVEMTPSDKGFQVSRS